MSMKTIQSELFDFIKSGVGKEVPIIQTGSTNWEALFTIAQNHGIAAFVFDGINKCFEKGIKIDIDFRTKMEWIGLTQQIEQRYRQYEKNIKKLGAFYREYGIRMMVLKGYGLAQNYPIPCHRPCGDVDIYLFGEQEKADKLLQEKLGVTIDNSHHHHTVFRFKDETVENHYDFLNVHVRPSNKRIEEKLKKLANIDDNDNLDDNIIYPSVEFNAIYLIRHCAGHFASTEMNVRQILDWGFFMEKHNQEINWDEYIPYIKQEGMYRFYNLLGLFCMKHLGFDASIFHGLYNDDLFERFSNEIMEPEFKDHENGKLLHSLSVKPRRWWHNRWKNRLCYKESAWEEFAFGLWAKVLKPSHFIQ